MRFDRLARIYSGDLAYYRDWRGPNKTGAYNTCAEATARSLAAGAHPDLRVLLTHEHPLIIRNHLRRCGIDSDWVLYEPDREAAMERVKGRQVPPSVWGEMARSWAALQAQSEPPVRLITMEDEVVAAYAA